MKIDSMVIEDAVTETRDISIKEAIGILYHKHVGSIVIIDKDGKCEGIFTERDAIRVVAMDVSLDKPLEEVMTTNLKTVRKGATFSEAKNIMMVNNVRHLPVTDEQGKFIGLLSLRIILDEIHDVHQAKR